MKSKKINVVLANTGKDLRLSGIAAKFCKNIKVIARQGIDYPLKNNFIYKFVYNKIASEIVANSEATKHTMLNSAQWLDIDKVKVIYNGIDPDLYSSSNTKDLREELGLTKDDFIIGFVGRLSVQKGIQYALDGFKIVSEKYDNAHLLICGDGELKSFVENFISHNALQKKIHLLGFRNDIPNIMRTIDVLLTPSLWEGFGIVLIEAMASQKVCIASRTSSIPEIISDGVNGFLIPPEDSNSIAEAVSKLITSPDLVKDFGANGLRIFKEKFTLDSMITNYERCF